MSDVTAVNYSRVKKDSLALVHYIDDLYIASISKYLRARDVHEGEVDEKHCFSA